MSYTPPVVFKDGQSVKVLDNWKIIQVHGGTVCAVSYDKDDNHLWVTTEIVGGKQDMVRTKSGSVYQLPKGSAHPSLWKIGLQLKRPEQYARLEACGVL